MADPTQAGDVPAPVPAPAPSPAVPPEYYQLDHQGNYAGAAVVDPDPENPGEWLVPGGCIQTPPPAPKDGFTRHWTGTDWEYLEVELLGSTPAQVPEMQAAAFPDVQHRALDFLERQVREEMHRPFSARPDGDDQPARIYQAGDVDLYIILGAYAGLAVAASPDYVHKFRCAPDGTSAITAMPHDPTQIARVYTGMMARMEDLRDRLGSLVSEVAAATDMASLDAAMAKAMNTLAPPAEAPANGAPEYIAGTPIAAPPADSAT